MCEVLITGNTIYVEYSIIIYSYLTSFIPSHLHVSPTVEKP